MVEYKEPLTHESIRQKFKSQFDLVNYAIQMADQMIQSGRGARIVSDSQNPAVLIIGEIEEGKDTFEDVPIQIKDIIVDVLEEPEINSSPVKSKRTEKKKTRRILTA